MQRRAFARLAFLAGALLISEAAYCAPVLYVASTGNDTKPCTLSAPCRTLQRAIDTAPAGGEVRVLDSGNFGAATIGKSLTVSSDGKTVFGQITVQAPGAEVVFREFILNGRGIATEGIYIKAAATVYIERCEVVGSDWGGVYSDAPGVKIHVVDSMFRDNHDAGFAAYYSDPAPPNFGPEQLAIDNSRFENNGYDGLLLGGGTSTITRSTFVGNGAHGIVLNSGRISIADTVVAHNGVGIGLNFSRATIESTISEDNGSGFYASSDEPDSVAFVLSNSVVTHNKTTGVVLVSGSGLTRGNNTVVDNPTNVAGTLTPFPGM